MTCRPGVCFSTALRQIVLFPGPREGGEMASFPMFVRELNHGGIPSTPHTIINLCQTNTQCYIHGPRTYTWNTVVNIVCVMRECPEVIWTAISHCKVCLWPPTDWVWEATKLPDAIVCFESMSGKCVAGDSMIVGVLPSSCSYMKPVVEVINEQKASCRQCDHEDVICAHPLIICVLIMYNWSHVQTMDTKPLPPSSLA